MIKQLVLTNFKKYSHKTISFKKGTTILVGGNNEGKSTLLHALAIWEFCKHYLTHMRGIHALCIGFHGDGVGMNIDDFSPVHIPELKYLWTNLKPSSGYNLKIKCVWELEDETDAFLELSLALSNERLFIKTTDTNLRTNTFIPSIAYLPPFAGISDKETWHYPAERKRLIGRGLAGAVLRNTIIDMHNDNLDKRNELKGDRTKIKNSDLASLRKTDPFEQLNRILYDTFKCQIIPHPFNVSFHNYVKVDLVKGEMQGSRFKAYPNFKKRDIMVEGSGFLQWLSVYTFALDKSINVLLLDEPDAHLHCSLQTTLVSKLIKLAERNNKQIIIATHSTEIVKNIPYEYTMTVNGAACRYLSSSSEKTLLLSGLGTEYSPILNEAQKTKNILFVENESDAIILKMLAQKMSIQWPINLTIWPTSFTQKERNHAMLLLKDQIPDIKSISLVDLDRQEYNTTEQTLLDKTFGADAHHPHIRYRKWRRSEIENYLLYKPAMARVKGVTEDYVDDFFRGHGIAYPELEEYLQSERTNATKPLFELEGKEILDAYCQNELFNKYALVNEIRPEEVCEDLRTLINEIYSMCSVL